MVFVAIGMITLATVTMLSMQKNPDNSTPELENESITNEALQKPFLSGMQWLLLGVLVAMIGIVIVLVLNSLRSKGGW
jgi:predicted anti-sigma-YlaC factor YlaD